MTSRTSPRARPYSRLAILNILLVVSACNSSKREEEASAAEKRVSIRPVRYDASEVRSNWPRLRISLRDSLIVLRRTDGIFAGIQLATIQNVSGGEMRLDSCDDKTPVVFRVQHRQSSGSWNVVYGPVCSRYREGVVRLSAGESRIVTFSMTHSVDRSIEPSFDSLPEGGQFRITVPARAASGSSGEFVPMTEAQSSSGPFAIRLSAKGVASIVR